MISAQTEFLISLFILLACAILAGELALRLGQLALVGQLLVGVLLGPTLVGPYIGLSVVTPQLSAVQLLATFFLLFLAGMEMGPSRVYGMSFQTLVLGLLIFFVPFTTTLAVVLTVAPGLGTLTGAFVAVTLSITALPVMAVMIRELGLTEREFGQVVMTAALVNELSAVTVFAVLLQLDAARPNVDWIAGGEAVGATALFLAVVFGVYLILQYVRGHPRVLSVSGRVLGQVRTQEAGFALLMVLSLGAALFSQYLGLTFVIGAFYAGILVTPESIGRKIHDSVRNSLTVIMWGLFIPLFFAITGLQTDFRLLGNPVAGGAFTALLLVAVLSKVFTGSIIARLGGSSMPDAVALGFLVNSRGAVEIAMAVILFSSGILDTFWFTLVVAVGLVCTVIAPVGAIATWMSTPETRADLFARAPNLRIRRAMFVPPEDEPDSR